ncbi:MAG: DUF481 domain-containing protein [Acidobacteria bacterium]|nr:DUF481 domain-containing protein [Acidobacteriota bacterium]
MRKRAKRMIALLGLLLAAGSGPRADELYTRGGEHLSGTVVSESAETVAFRSSAFGVLTVPRSAIARLERGASPAPTAAVPTEPAAAVEAGAPAQGSGAVSPAPPAPAPLAGPASGADAVDAARTRSMEKAFLRILQPFRGWQTVFRFGLMMRRGRDSDVTLDLGYRTEKTIPGNREYLLTFSYYRKDDVNADGSRKAKDDNLDGGFRFRRYLRPRWFFQANTNYYRDPIVNLLNEANQVFGVGYWLLKGGRVRLSVGPFAGVQYAEYTTSRGWHFVAGVFQDLDCKLPFAFRAREVFFYLQDPRNAYNHMLRFNLEISQPLSRVVSLGFVWDYTFAGESGGNVSRNQHRLGLNLGVHF